MAEKKSATPNKGPKFIHNYTPINKRPVIRELHDADDTRTERAGYVPMEHRIRNITAAGKNLDKARRAQYHYGEGEPINDNFADFAPDTNLDLADIADIANDGRLAMEESQRLRQESIDQQTKKERSQFEERIKELQSQPAEPPAEPPAESPAEPAEK